ncbi:oocyte zinc finger protein XlCOF6-like isoform X1 [Amblyraja radiata]|uniref:oocyte zinc finger protein XlCOF6-like isoform X1 n=1 Tax=Amblyraja radiata TaxID=386614 RepID=UPI001403F7E3|nr:oocyte zinc finger protein XlCOF6-like isoform X1 [Amblyraja radiata]
MIILKKMNDSGFDFQNIPPVSLRLSDETTTARLCTGLTEGIEDEFKSLVEVFLVEVYCCKICAFTSSLKVKMNTHMEGLHRRKAGDGGSKMAGASGGGEEGDVSYVSELEMESKANIEEDSMGDNLERMSFLLPMYGMLHNISPVSCELAARGDRLHAPEPSFEGETAEEAGDEAQSEHLMSLGLCRISGGGGSRVESTGPGNAGGDHRRKLGKKRRSEAGTRSGGGRYLCRSCELELGSKVTYNLHMDCHDEAGSFRCVHCPWLASEWPAMQRHLDTHGAQRWPYRCPTCSKVFTRHSSWKSHQLTHTHQVAPYHCPKCPAFYPSELLRDSHAACHAEGAFKCTQCDFTDESWSVVDAHLRSHDSSLKTHMCLESGQSFLRGAALKDQESEHKDSLLFPCHFCGQAYKSRRQRNKHRRQVHRKVPERRRVKENNPASGRREEKGPHAKERKVSKGFSCSICTRRCSSKLALQRHMGTHTGIKPFHCQHCDYKTRLKASLVQHMRVHTASRRRAWTSTCAGITRARDSAAAPATTPPRTSSCCTSTCANTSRSRESRRGATRPAHDRRELHSRSCSHISWPPAVRLISCCLPH